jgi:hypothetical protein
MRVFAGNNRQAAICFEQYLSAGVRVPSAHFNPAYIGFYRLLGRRYDTRARGFAEQRYPSVGSVGRRGAERQRRRHRENSCTPRGGVGTDHKLPRIGQDGSRPGGLRRAGDRAGSVVATNSPCHELFLVRPQSDLCIPRILRPSCEGNDRARLRRSSNAARLVGIEKRRGIHDCALQGRLSAWFLGAALDRALGPAKRPAENAPCAARSC